MIENVGKGLARDIKFFPDKTIPEKAFGTSIENAKMPAVMKSGPLITGIPSLGPGGKRIITWGQYYGLLKGIDDDVINIKVRYRSKRSIFPGYKNHTTLCSVDIRSFEGTDASDNNWDKKLYEEVSTISRCLRNMLKTIIDSKRRNEPAIITNPTLWILLIF